MCASSCFQELKGVHLLTDTLELTLGVTPEGNPPKLLPSQETERAMEILKVLFNITLDSIKGRWTRKTLLFTDTWGPFSGTV